MNCNQYNVSFESLLPRQQASCLITDLTPVLLIISIALIAILIYLLVNKKKVVTE